MIVWATGLKDTDPDELECAVEDEMEALRSVERQEVERAITRTETKLLHLVEGLASRADLLSMYQTIFGNAGHLDGELDRLRAVGAEKVRTYAESTLGSDNRALLTYVPKPGE